MSVTRLELFGTRIVYISPFVRNLYLLIGKSIIHSTLLSNYLFQFSNILLWLSCYMGINGNLEKFCRRIKTTFSCCMSTDIRLFSCNIIK